MQIDTTSTSMAAVWQKMAQLEQAAASISSQLANFKEELQQASGSSSGSVSTTLTPMSAAAGLSSSSAASAVSAQTTVASAETEPAEDPGADVKAALSAAMTKAGLDPAALPMTYWRQNVWYPDGSYTHNSISVQMPDGQTETFDADLTLLSPHVTVDSLLFHLGMAQTFGLDQASLMDQRTQS